MRENKYCQFRAWFRGGFIYHCPFEINEYEYPLDMIVQQNTGLKDGETYIYEGDIIGDGEFKGIVWYDTENARFDVKIGKDITNGISEMCLNTFADLLPCKILGNIYKNPEFNNTGKLSKQA
jgi:hypothetical protein